MHPEVVSLPSVAAIFSGPLHREVDDFATAVLVSSGSPSARLGDELLLRLVSDWSGTLALLRLDSELGKQRVRSSLSLFSFFFFCIAVQGFSPNTLGGTNRGRRL